MKKYLLATASLCLLSAALVSGAQAADLGSASAAPVVVTPDFDIAFGTKLSSDYNFRGVTQSDHGPSISGYMEARYKWLYVGLSGSSVKLVTAPSMELDIYGGVRPTFGNWTFDLGAIHYYYPNEGRITGLVANTDMTEFYGKIAYDFSGKGVLGANLFYSGNVLGTGADGTYASLTGKVNLPYDLALSGELGRWWLGDAKNSLLVGGGTGLTSLADYTYYNVGLSYTYKAVTLDVRYHGTDLKTGDCAVFAGNSTYCRGAVIGSISFDTTLGALK